MNVFIERDNRVYLNLFRDETPVTPNAVTRAIFRFGEYCLDTDIDTDLIWFKNDKQTVVMQPGLVENLIPNKCVGNLTIFDSNNPHGLAWGRTVKVDIKKWPLCEDD